jgi:hypothetical protein
VGFGPEQAHDVGELLRQAGTSDVVDAHLVLIASKIGATVYSSDEEDLEQLSNSLPRPVVIRRVGPRRRGGNR